MKVEGVDPLVVNKVLGQVAGSQVQDSKGAKITIDKRKQQGEQQTRQDLEQSTEQLNRTVEAFNIKLRFKVDQENEEMYIYLIDTVEGKVIRRIPPETLLEAASRMQHMVGLILDALI